MFVASVVAKFDMHAVVAFFTPGYNEPTQIDSTFIHLPFGSIITVTAAELDVYVVLLACTLFSSAFSTLSYIREHWRRIWSWWHWSEASLHLIHVLLAILALIFTFLFLNSSDIKFQIASFVVLLMVAIDLFLDVSMSKSLC